MGHTGGFQARDIFLRDNTTYHNSYVLRSGIVEHATDAGEQYAVRARKDADTDPIHIFLDGRADDLFRRAAQSGVNHFHASLKESTSDDARTHIVAVESNLCYQNSNPSVILRHGGSKLESGGRREITEYPAPDIDNLSHRCVRTNGFQDRRYNIFVAASRFCDR